MIILSISIFIFFIYFFIRESLLRKSQRGTKGEPVGLCGLKKWVTEAKDGPLELRRKNGSSEENEPGEVKRERYEHVTERERERGESCNPFLFFKKTA